MENLTSEGNSYEEMKRHAELLYSKLGHVWSPRLKDDIVFDKSGFQHLIWKNGLPRPKNEQKRRFALLDHTKKIITNPNAIFSHEQRENAQFWTFTNKQGGKIIKVVIRQTGNGKKRFLSIFEKQ